MYSQLPFVSGGLSFICKLKTLHAVMTAFVSDRRGVYRVLVGKPKGKRQLRRPRRRWEKSIKKNLYRLFESSNELSSSKKFGEFLDYLRTWKLLKKESV